MDQWGSSYPVTLPSPSVGQPMVVPDWECVHPAYLHDAIEVSQGRASRYVLTTVPDNATIKANQIKTTLHVILPCMEANNKNAKQQWHTP